MLFDVETTLSDTATVNTHELMLVETSTLSDVANTHKLVLAETSMLFHAVTSNSHELTNAETSTHEMLLVEGPRPTRCFPMRRP